MTLSKKLFLSLIGLTLMVLVATLLLARWSFEQGFTQYLVAQEEQRLTRISKDLINLYVSSGEAWDKKHTRPLHQIITRHSGQGPQNSRPPGPRSRPPGKRPPPPGGRPPLDNPPAELVGISTVVYTAEGEELIRVNYVEASPQASIQEQSVMFNGKVIATLKSWNNTKFGSDIAEKFSQQQLVTSLIIGMSCLIMAAILALYWSRSLLRPIKSIMASLQALTTGNYKQHIQHQRQDELGEVLDNLNKLANVLEQTRSAKNRWFADISHELRTPLTVLIGELDAIKAGVRKFDDAQLSSLQDEALLLKRLIDDLYQLSTSDIGALRYQFEAIDFSNLSKKLTNSYSESFDLKNISFMCELVDGLMINADKDRISQLLTNLLSNSVRYTNANGKIKCTLQVEQNALVFVIEDSPPGATQHEYAQFFDPLYRADIARTKNSTGAGLGLAICKNIVQAHHGKISAGASELGGVKVSVSLPLLKHSGTQKQGKK